MSQISAPPQSMIDFVIEVARQSPCAKSKRGAVLFDDKDQVWGTGWNGPPPQVGGSLATCDGSATCREHCAKRCVHAETRAVIAAMAFVNEQQGNSGFPTLLHVKIDERGNLVAGGGPSCWQCSKLIVDVGFVTGVWLYQRAFADGPGDHQAVWRWYKTDEFHRITAATCKIA